MAVAEQVAQRRVEAEKRFLLEGVPWWTYVALRDALDDRHVLMTYLEGALELMSPSETHEEEKKIIARLLEAFADEEDIDLRGFGGATFRKELAQRGLEPDECYSVGPKPEGDVPHLAIEVVVSNPLLDKLSVYAGLGVPEVWTWNSPKRTLTVRRLSKRGYEIVSRSGVLPQIDLALLASFVRAGESHTALVKAFREALRA